MDRELTQPPPARGGRRAARLPWPAALAMGLASLGIVVSLLAARWASPWWEHRGGPALTVAGAVVWLVLRRRAGQAHKSR